MSKLTLLAVPEMVAPSAAAVVDDTKAEKHGKPLFSALHIVCAESQIMQISEAPMYIFRKLWITPSKRTKKRGHLFVKQFFSE